jgi:hypothetical protein
MFRIPFRIYRFIHFAHFYLQNTYTNAVSHYPPIEPGMSIFISLSYFPTVLVATLTLDGGF